MDLLTIKSGASYIQVKNGSYLLCRLDKASVFPMNLLEEVREHVNRACVSGVPDASIFRLALVETPFENGSDKASQTGKPERT